jgi:hypothetical protein
LQGNDTGKLLGGEERGNSTTLRVTRTTEPSTPRNRTFTVPIALRSFHFSQSPDRNGKRKNRRVLSFTLRHPKTLSGPPLCDSHTNRFTAIQRCQFLASRLCLCLELSGWHRECDHRLHCCRGWQAHCGVGIALQRQCQQHGGQRQNSLRSEPRWRLCRCVSHSVASNCSVTFHGIPLVTRWCVEQYRRSGEVGASRIQRATEKSRNCQWPSSILRLQIDSRFLCPRLNGLTLREMVEFLEHYPQPVSMWMTMPRVIRAGRSSRSQRPCPPSMLSSSPHRRGAAGRRADDRDQLSTSGHNPSRDATVYIYRQWAGDSFAIMTAMSTATEQQDQRFIKASARRGAYAALFAAITVAVLLPDRTGASELGR